MLALLSARVDPGSGDGTLQLPAGTPTGRVTVAITPADEALPTGGEPCGYISIRVC
jgi:hypothetical protein